MVVSITDNVIDDNGRPLNGAKVWVYLRGTTTLVTVYSDSAGANPLAQPVLTSRGRINAYVAVGAYDLFVVYGQSSWTQQYDAFTAEDGMVPPNTVFVRADGSDLKNGGSWYRAFRTIEKAHDALRVLGGGTCEIGPNINPGDFFAGRERGFRLASNTRTRGRGRQTIITNSNANGIVSACGFMNDAAGYGDDPTPGTGGNDNIWIEDLTIDLSAASDAQSNLCIAFLGVRTGGVRNVKTIAGAQGLVLGSGGTSNQWKCDNIQVDGGCEFVSVRGLTTFGLAITNASRSRIIGNLFRAIDPGGTLAGVYLLDIEPNTAADTVQGTVIQGSTFDGAPIHLSPGSATDPSKMTGVAVSGNTLLNGAAIDLGIPAVVTGNDFVGSQAISLLAVQAILADVIGGSAITAKGSYIGGNRFYNVSESSLRLSPIVIFSGVSGVTVGPNVMIHDAGAGSAPDWAVEEQGTADGNTIHPQTVTGTLKGEVKRVGAQTRIIPVLPNALQRFQVGSYYFSRHVGGGIGGRTLVAGRVYYTPLDIGEDLAVDQLALNVQAAVAATTVRLGVYTDSGGLPKTPLIDGGTVSSATTGVKTVSPAKTYLKPGPYWLAVKAEGGTPAVYGLPLNGFQGLVGQPNLAFGNNVVVGYTEDQASGAFLTVVPANLSTSPEALGIGVKAAAL